MKIKKKVLIKLGWKWVGKRSKYTEIWRKNDVYIVRHIKTGKIYVY